MAGDLITTGLIISAVSSTASAVQQVGVAASAAKQRKRSQEIAIAQDKKEAAQAEELRQERLSRLLSQQRAGLAASGVAGGGQSALASANRLVSETNAASARMQTTKFRPQSGLASVSRQVFSSLNTLGGQASRLPGLITRTTGGDK